MDKHLIGRVSAIALAAILAVVLFILPGIFRVDMVASMGVLAVNTLTLILNWVGVAFGAGGVALGAVTARKVIIAKRAADALALEAATPYVLPSKDETRPDVIRKHLVDVQKKYAGTEVADLVGESLEQLRLLQQHLGNIGDIFRANLGLLSQTDTQFESGKFEILLGRVIEEACKDLMRIIYQAFARKGDSEAPIEPLADTIRQTNAENQTRVDLARELSDKAAETATELDGDTSATTATHEVQELIVRLDQTNRKQVF